jgi:D-lyxose ketol-isomerase
MPGSGNPMKRSEINAIIENAMSFFKEMGFHLPPFAFFSLSDWEKNREAAKEIFDLKLGWDITDFGRGDFRNTGLLLFTIRNGRPHGPEYPKTYAEKIMIVEEGQATPLHFHWNKMEDIINRGGGNLVMELSNSTDDEKPDSTDVEVKVDGMIKKVKPGGKLVLYPGESISLPRRLYHTFYGEKSKGKVLVGEVSTVNDDERDNRFLVDFGRFSKTDEDAPPRYLLCGDYEARVKPGRP